MKLTVISGTPGSGKTALSAYLAGCDAKGVHVETDHFFRFLAHRVDPSLPEAHAQNLTVVRAYTTAALAYSDGGYAVYLDGVIGPWLLAQILSLVPGCDYVLLHASLETVLARATSRPTQRSASEGVIRRMHAQFEGVLEEYRSHVIETERKSVEQVAHEYQAAKVQGAFSLSSAQAT